MLLDLNRTDACGQCEYDLTGLPVRGQCPECGHAYDLQRGSGLTRDPAFASRRIGCLRHGRTMVLVALAASVYLCGSGVSRWTQMPGTTQAIGTFIAMLLGIAAIASYIHEQSDAPKA